MRTASHLVSMICAFTVAIAAVTPARAATPAVSPADRTAEQVPKEALCAVCAVREGTTALEKVVAWSGFEGKRYYFCSKDCKKAFDEDPAAFIPAALPRSAPSITAYDLADNETTLAPYAGKAVLVDFWATWCKPCVKSMPQLNAIYNEFSGRGLVVIGISIDKEGGEKVRQFLKKRKISYPIWLDSSADDPAWEAFGVKVVPTAFLIDQDGQIVRRWTGAFDESELRAAVATILGDEKE